MVNRLNRHLIIAFKTVCIIKTVFITACMFMFLQPGIAQAQLSDLEVTQINPDTPIPVFSNYPGMAAVEIRSSLTNLQFESTWNIVDQLGDAQEGRYILIIEPVRQSLIISASGYMQSRIALQITEPRAVEYYTVEPKNRTVTERGTLIVQTNPEGATLELDGVPGQYTSNYTFDDILAQSYILRISLDEHQTEERLVTVTPTRPAVERIDLIHNFGFLVVESEETRLFLTHEEDGREFRFSYRPNEPQKLDIGNYTYRATRDGYSDATGVFNVEPDAVVRLNPQLDATFGFLSVTADQDEIELFIAQEGGGLETRIENPGSANTRLPIGSYRYRATREGYSETTGTFEVEPGAIVRLDPQLEATFGFLNVIAEQDDIDLFITQEGGVLETQIENPESTNTRLTIGTYRYRATQTYYMQQEGVFDISRESVTNLNVSLEPAYGTLSVESNTPRIRLTAVDNEAPPASANNEINLESGRHIVRVEAAGHATQELEIYIEPGQSITETVQLETADAQEERLAREALPRGILEVAADLDADIFVDGEKRGVGEIAVTLMPGTYEVKVQHPIRSKTFQANVPPAGVFNEQVILRPSRSGAITRSLILPGIGHTYTKRSRGYLYLAAIAGAGTFAYLNHQQQQTYQDDFNILSDRYQSANSTTEAASVRAEMESMHSQLNTAYNLKMASIYAAAGLYLLQLTDLLITNPEHGYRGSSDNRISLSAGAGGFNLRIAIR